MTDCEDISPLVEYHTLSTAHHHNTLNKKGHSVMYLTTYADISFLLQQQVDHIQVSLPGGPIECCITILCTIEGEM